MLKQFAKHPELQVVGEIEKADVVLVFGTNTFSMGSFTNMWSDTNGNAYSTTTPRYGITGEGSAVKCAAKHSPRCLAIRCDSHDCFSAPAIHKFHPRFRERVGKS